MRPLRVRTGVGGGRSRVRSLVERYGGGVEESYGGTHGLEGLSRGGGGEAPPPVSAPTKPRSP